MSSPAEYVFNLLYYFYSVPWLETWFMDFDAVICLVEGFDELESLNLYYVVNDWFFLILDLELMFS